jgi:prolyl oligopeptidase
VTNDSEAPGSGDPYRWLEDVDGEDALAWVRKQNAVSTEVLGSEPGFEDLRRDLLTILDSKERIPMVAKHGPYLYNFWQDADHPRGIWRRTTFDSYRTDDPRWDVLIDVDELNRTEDENWVWHGVWFLRPQSPDERWERCFIALSRGGADADVTREFDLEQRAFVEHGFYRPEAKGDLRWINRDTVYVRTDFGEGSMTDSGYTRIVKRWTRGTPMSDAVTVFEGRTEDMIVSAYRDQTPGFVRDFVVRRPAFFSSELYLLRGGDLVRIDVPDSAQVGVHREWLMVVLRDPWTIDGTTFPAGSLIVTDFERFLAGERRFDVLYEQDDASSLAGISWTKNHLLLNVLEHVKNKVFVLTPHEGGWTREPLDRVPDNGTVTVWAVDDEESDDYFMLSQDFITPSTLWLGTIGAGAPETLKSMPAFFDAEGLAVAQHFTTSDDGTRVPYFEIGPKDRSGPLPTILNAYGGFQVSRVPVYMPAGGRGWLEGGGVYVVANIRGGGEYGPRWWKAALREHRPRAYEDLASVARDLVARGVTTHDQLGVTGGSNGGLLVGNMLTRYPELFAAIVCHVPLLDMQRYHKLLAGASWVAEYGDPDDPGDWAFLEGFSPYHNVKAEAQYPPVLFSTSTRDDRVHPGHARKMMARMLEQGHDVLYYENIEGGHGGAADNAQLAYMNALDYTFLKQRLFTREGSV